MEDTSVPTDMIAPTASPTYTYTDPISSFFGGIFFIIIFFLVIVFMVILLVARAFGLASDAPAPPAEVKKEKFKDGPPYPRCQTNGAFAMF
jgi:hypothetical protein